MAGGRRVLGDTSFSCVRRQVKLSTARKFTWRGCVGWDPSSVTTDRDMEPMTKMGMVSMMIVVKNVSATSGASGPPQLTPLRLEPRVAAEAGRREGGGGGGGKGEGKWREGAGRGREGEGGRRETKRSSPCTGAQHGYWHGTSPAAACRQSAVDAGGRDCVGLSPTSITEAESGKVDVDAAEAPVLRRRGGWAHDGEDGKEQQPSLAADIGG